MNKKATKPVKTPLERAINSRRKGIERMEANKKKVMDRALAECAEIDRNIAQKRVLLEALERGALKP